MFLWQKQGPAVAAKSWFFRGNDPQLREHSPPVGVVLGGKQTGRRGGDQA
jgi:hypothetical protein